MSLFLSPCFDILDRLLWATQHQRVRPKREEVPAADATVLPDTIYFILPANTTGNPTSTLVMELGTAASLFCVSNLCSHLDLPHKIFRRPYKSRDISRALFPFQSLNYSCVKPTQPNQSASCKRSDVVRTTVCRFVPLRYVKIQATIGYTHGMSR